MKTGNLKFSLILALTWLLFPIIGSAISCTSHMTTPPAPTPFPPRQIVTASPPLLLDQKWRARSGTIPGYYRFTAVSTQSGLVFANQDQQLTLLDRQTGQPTWITEYEGRADSIVANEETIFLASGFRITAYDLAQGRQLWQTDQLADRRGYYLYLRDGFLFAHESSSYKDGDVIHQFDLQTGLELDTLLIPLKSGNLTFDWPLEQIYLRSNEDWLLAIDWQTDKTLWQVKNEWGPIAKPTVVNNEFLVISAGRVELDMMVVEIYSGNILWRSSGLVSNPVVLGNQVYTVASDSSIQAYELHNGDKLGEISLRPPYTDGTRYIYGLLTDEENSLIYAYFGDSQEIITFERSIK